jgi:transposase-like protein
MEPEPDEHLAPVVVAIHNEIINPHSILGINPEPPDVDKQRREIIALVVNEHLSVRDAATQLHVTQTQVRRQRHKFETGQRICAKPGAPRKLDVVAERKLVQTVKSRARESKALLKDGMSTLFEELVNETAVRRGVGNAPLSMARSTKKSYLDANKLVVGSARRRRVLVSEKNETSEINVAGVSELPPERVFNFDATYLTSG